ncbi:MAG: hypothetical protein KF739_00720 [Cryobacterium sp.]|nr:hypothetical protein [Micrococcales bacterium]MBX3308941.1 hypothetical protein [Cryobacterium sp.]
MIVTAGLAIIANMFLEPDQIASVGAFLYLAMDIAIPWGVIRHLRSNIRSKVCVPLLAIMLDVAVLISFALFKVQSDLLTVIAATSVAVVVLIARVFAVPARSRAGWKA